jgi:hypothetical protein
MDSFAFQRRSNNTVGTRRRWGGGWRFDSCSILIVLVAEPVKPFRRCADGLSQTSFTLLPRRFRVLPKM